MSFFDDLSYQWSKGDKNWHIHYNNALTALKNFMGDKGTNADLGSGLASAQNEIAGARDGQATLLAKNQAQDARMNVEHNADGTHTASASTAVDFKASGDTPTFVSNASFTVPTDKTATYTAGRRLMVTLSGGTVYATVKSSTFASVTTITIEETNLDNTISAVSYGITSAGAAGSIPAHDHTSSEQGGNINQPGIAENARRIAELEAGTSDHPQDIFVNETKVDTASAMITSANSAQKVVSVDSVAGFSVGDSLDLLNAADASLSETVKIASINALDITAVNNLVNSYGWGSFAERSGASIQNGKLVLPAGTGDGRDGSVILSVAKNINTDVIGSLRSVNPDGIVTTVTANPTGTSIPVASITGFADGDKLVLINLQGGPGDIADVGNYEILTVNGAPSGTTINVRETIAKSYDGLSFAAQKVIVQRIPQWTFVTIQSGGDLTCNAWNGTSGGVMAILSTIQVDVQAGGKIQADGKGYRGGVKSTGLNISATQGESRTGLGSPNSNPNDGAGGGGLMDGSSRSSGGGGAHFANGVDGTNNGPQTATTGKGGVAYGIPDLSSGLFFGSGGGGGPHDNTVATGGIGGGIIYIATNSLTTAGTISVDGADSTVASPGGSGGGGGAGALFLQSNIFTPSAATSSSVKGVGSANTPVGGDGGDGRIRFDYRTINGMPFPDATQENAAATPDPEAGNNAMVPNIRPPYTAARYRSLAVSRPQRDIDIFTAWLRQSVNVSHGSTSGTATASVISGITAGEQTKYGVGDSVIVKLSTGKYLTNADGTIYKPAVTINSTSGQITVDTAIPSTFSGATLQRMDAIPRASVVGVGAAESMAAMTLEVVEAIAGSTDIRCEWSYTPAVDGQDVNIEIGLSTEDSAQQQNVYCEEYVSLLEFAS